MSDDPGGASTWILEPAIELFARGTTTASHVIENLLKSTVDEDESRSVLGQPVFEECPSPLLVKLREWDI